VVGIIQFGRGVLVGAIDGSGNLGINRGDHLACCEDRCDGQGSLGDRQSDE
jgi:hypothetical protein